MFKINKMAAGAAACAAAAGLLLPSVAAAEPPAPALVVDEAAGMLEGAPAPLIAQEAQRAGVAIPAGEPPAADLGASPSFPVPAARGDAGEPTAAAAAAVSELRLTAATVVSKGQQFPGSNRPINFAGDGGPAINATVSRPTTVIPDRKGGYYFTDSMNHRVRQVSADGTIRTVAGSGVPDGPGCAWDVPALNACIWVPHGIDVDGEGNLIITDTFHNVITKLGQDGVLRRVAGTGEACNRSQSTCGEGGNALDAALLWPTIARHTPQGLIIADSANRVMRVDTDGVLTRIAGNGNPGLSGDWGPATSARLYAPADAIPFRGGVLISDGNNCRLRWVDPQGIIKPFAGYGGDITACWNSYALNPTRWGGPQTGDVGDGRNATMSRLSVTGFFTMKGEDVYVTDFLNSRVRKIGPDDIITTFLGTGDHPGVNTDGPAPLRNFRLAWPSGIAYDDVSERILVTDPGAHRVVGVSFTSGFLPLPAKTVTRVRTGAANTTVYGNATTAGATARGYLTVYPCAAERPLASNSNYAVNSTIATFVLAQSDADGDICFYNASSTHIIWDQLGYETETVSYPPTRKVDTRVSGNRLTGGATLAIPTGAAPGTAVGGTLTVVNPAKNGWVVAFPCGATIPTASNINFSSAGAVVANTAIVRADQDGNICVYSTTATDILWDQVMETNAVPVSDPVRVVDTRLDGGAPVPAGQAHRIVVEPSSRVYANLTVTSASGDGYATVYPCDQPRPLASNINFRKGQTVANFVVADSDKEGGVCVYTTSATHLVWDQVAAKPLAEGGASSVPQRLLDTRGS